MNKKTVDVLIIGAGFAGLYMLYKTRQLGLSAVVVEAGNNVGGTWFWNRYPGARCDVESMEYSFEFSKELQQEWDWPERFSAQPDILEYINHVADRFELRSDIQFNTRVNACHYDEQNVIWTTTTADTVFTSQFVVAATGCLSQPMTPNIQGIETFTGKTYHTGKWPHEGVDFSGKKVAVIGTGSSAVQSIPIIAEQAEHLTVFQRTPAYSIPARNRTLATEEKDKIKSTYDALRAKNKTRYLGAGGLYLDNQTPMSEQNEQEREAMLEYFWEVGGLLFMLSYPDLLLDQATNEYAAEFVRKKIVAKINDPVLAKKLTPRGTIASKRLCSDTGYYETFNRDNVSLVDASDAAIQEITETGIKTTEELLEFDAIVLATGYDAMTGALTNIDIRGTDNASIKEKWEDHVSSYLGIQVAGFPNLFTVACGVGSQTVLTNVVKSIEHHVEWVSDCLAHMQANSLRSIQATHEAELEWTAQVNEIADTTLFADADSWYTGANVEGKTKEFAPFIGGFPVYRELCDEAVKNNYHGFALS